MDDLCAKFGDFSFCVLVLSCKQTYRITDRITDRQTDRQTDGQTDGITKADQRYTHATHVGMSNQMRCGDRSSTNRKLYSASNYICSITNQNTLTRFFETTLLYVSCIKIDCQTSRAQSNV